MSICYHGTRWTYMERFGFVDRILRKLDNQEAVIWSQ